MTTSQGIQSGHHVIPSEVASHSPLLRPQYISTDFHSRFETILYNTIDILLTHVVTSCTLISQPPRLFSNPFRITPFAHPCQLTPMESNLSEKQGGDPLARITLAYSQNTGNLSTSLCSMACRLFRVPRGISTEASISEQSRNILPHLVLPIRPIVPALRAPIVQRVVYPFA